MLCPAPASQLHNVPQCPRQPRETDSGDLLQSSSSDMGSRQNFSPVQMIRVWRQKSQIQRKVVQIGVSVDVTVVIYRGPDASSAIPQQRVVAHGIPCRRAGGRTGLLTFSLTTRLWWPIDDFSTRNLKDNYLGSPSQSVID